MLAGAAASRARFQLLKRPQTAAEAPFLVCAAYLPHKTQLPSCCVNSLHLRTADQHAPLTLVRCTSSLVVRAGAGGFRLTNITHSNAQVGGWVALVVELYMPRAGAGGLSPD
jgi:hypothetical protein